MDTPALTQPDLQQAEHELLSDLRRLRRALRLRRPEGSPSVERSTRGQRVADVVAGVMGSWTFIVFQTVILFLWIAANLLGARREQRYTND